MIWGYPLWLEKPPASWLRGCVLTQLIKQAHLTKPWWFLPPP